MGGALCVFRSALALCFSAGEGRAGASDEVLLTKHSSDARAMWVYCCGIDLAYRQNFKGCVIFFCCIIAGEKKVILKKLMF